MEIPDITLGGLSLEDYQRKERDMRDRAAVTHDSRLLKSLGPRFGRYERQLFARELSGGGGAGGSGSGRLRKKPFEALNLLDIGCGTGRISRTLSTDIPLVVGMDFSFEMLRAYTVASPKASAVCGEAGALPFSDGTFDAVLACAVLPHIRETERIGVMREINRVLCGGGVFICNLPNAGYWNGSRTRRFLPEEVFYQRFTPGDVEALSRAADMPLLTFRYYKAVPGRVMRVLPFWFAAERMVAATPGLNGIACDWMLVALRKPCTAAAT